MNNIQRHIIQKHTFEDFTEVFGREVLQEALANGGMVLDVGCGFRERYLCILLSFTVVDEKLSKYACIRSVIQANYHRKQ